jgi:predicted RNA-binding Zn-ribbon protein involved in translation (DUF1610 family)
MVSPAGSLRKEMPVDATVSSLDTKLSPTAEPRQIARRSSHKPCPDCGSMTVRSRDGRDMCVICGYLQTHA